MPNRSPHDLPSDAYSDLMPSDAAPAWLRELHDNATSGLRSFEGGRAGSGVLAITEPNRIAAPAGVLKRATSAKRESNLLHEARVLALLQRTASRAPSLVPRLLGLWRLRPPDTLYMLTSTLSGIRLADLPAATGTPELSSQIGRLIDTLHDVQRPSGLTNEGAESAPGSSTRAPS